jgi:hypothetical protein
LFSFALLLAGSVGVANAATTDLEPPLNSDISLGSFNNISPFFNVSGPLSGTYDLIVRYGIWDGNGGSQQVDITLKFDNTFLATIDSTGAYFSVPQSMTFNVTSLVQPGVNVLSVEGIDASLSPSFVTSFAVGENSPPTPTPLPAALPLFAGALGVLGLAGARKRRKA